MAWLCSLQPHDGSDCMLQKKAKVMRRGTVTVPSRYTTAIPKMFAQAELISCDRC